MTITTEHLDDDAATVTLYLGDAAWHDGPGWYYVIDDYPDEGSCGAFTTRADAEKRARADGYRIAGYARGHHPPAAEQELSQ